MPRVPALFVHVYLPGCKCNYREGGRGGWWVVRVEGGGLQRAAGSSSFLFAYVYLTGRERRRSDGADGGRAGVMP